MLQIALTDVFSCLSITTKPNRRVGTSGWNKANAQVLWLRCPGHNGHRHSPLLQKSCREWRRSISCSGGNKNSWTPRSTFRRCIFLHCYLYHTALSRTELGTGALCRPVVITLQYSESLFSYMIIDCAKSSPALFTSNYNSTLSTLYGISMNFNSLPHSLLLFSIIPLLHYNLDSSTQVFAPNLYFQLLNLSQMLLFRCIIFYNAYLSP